MSNNVFQQNPDDKKGSQPSGTYLIQMLFKKLVPIPEKEKMAAVMEKHIGLVECFCHDKKTADFAALEYIAEFNVIERLNREIRRHTRVVGSFPDGNSALMLVCARLRHVAGTQWGNKK